jgi:hypothetical protein
MRFSATAFSSREELEWNAVGKLMTALSPSTRILDPEWSFLRSPSSFTRHARTAYPSPDVGSGLGTQGNAISI